jgi:predicted glycosyltransferase
MKNKTVIYAIINWGLGHATRSAPIIRRMTDDGNRVILASHGKALSLLEKEFPECECLDIRDRNVSYPHFRSMFVFKIVAQLPKMIAGWIYERRTVRKLIKNYQPDLIITEMRLGFWSKRVPSVLITHQLRFNLPKHLAWAGIFGEWFNRLVFRHYNYVFVPDAAGEPNLSGELSHKGRIARHPKVRYIGCLSSILPSDPPPAADLDLLVSISGPEPQRTKFEQKVMEQLPGLRGNILAVLGLPDAGDKNTEWNEGAVRVRAHLGRSEMADAMQRAKRIVCRSGYSTVMELLALNKAAFFVPTPGQTEQEYLAEYYRRAGLYDHCKQEDLNLQEILQKDPAPVKKNSIPVNDLDRISDLLDSLCR